MVMSLIAVGFAGMGIGVLIGVAFCLGTARRWRHDGKVLRKSSAQLVIIAEGLRKRALQDFEQARRARQHTASMIQNGFFGGYITEGQNLQLLRSQSD